jgi:cell division septation protein DedD
MQNPRWRRLSAGFRHEEALLLLYVSAEYLPTLAAEPDGLVVLAPQGLDLTVADNPALTAAVGHGTPVLAVIADEDKVTATPLELIPPPVVRFELADAHEADEIEEVPAMRGTEDVVVEGAREIPDQAEIPEEIIAGDRLSLPFEPLRRRGSAPMAFLVEKHAGKPKWPFVVMGLALAAAAALVWYSATQTRVEAEAPAADSAVVAAAQPAAPAQPAPPVESLPWTVPVASLPSLADALALADSLESRRVPAIVTPVRVRGRATFRVQAGPFASRSGADSELAQVRASRFAAGGPDSTPLSVALAGGMNRTQAFAERARLRQAGVPTFILGQDSGTFRLYAGAYDASAQAALLTDILTPTGGAGTLVPRSGYVP